MTIVAGSGIGAGVSAKPDQALRPSAGPVVAVGSRSPKGVYAGKDESAEWLVACGFLVPVAHLCAPMARWDRGHRFGLLVAWWRCWAAMRAMPAGLSGP